MAAPLQPVIERDSPDDVTNDMNTGNCSKIVVDRILANMLEFRIKRDSVDDVRAVIEQGAPVNFLYKVKFINFCFNSKEGHLVNLMCSEMSSIFFKRRNDQCFITPRSFTIIS